MKNRSYLREIIVKTLYQIFLYESKNIAYDLNEVIKELYGNKNDEIYDIVMKIANKKDSYISLINQFMKEWNFDRLGKVDQAILLLGVYELKDSKTPPVVAINEALELSKKYSDDKVIPMLNAVLDKIYHLEENHE